MLMLESTTSRLVDRHGLLMLDLDGVVYIGPDPVPEAPARIEQARAAGCSIAFVTNNAGRSPQQVADHLTALGVSADAPDVVTSGQAAARLLAAAGAFLVERFARLRLGRLRRVRPIRLARRNGLNRSAILTPAHAAGERVVHFQVFPALGAGEGNHDIEG